ncbi:glycoside hydrolase [Stereum hirsutum FP-91666 SS1]|uniref:glycoside hydrolase n=1 Tax=Stereum hirsutum (strain FP-91666) TaxID=721885 RepID=UPI000440C8F3|nr:glycoside hydrolase [Stereum hirsutum FP-91666 SS1]EIM91465.1 glycoside hydrolase [Stereum hirsutum FP-91666 SS1]
MDHYANIDNGGQSYAPNNNWMETPTKGRGSKAKWIIAGSIIGLLALIGVGVGVGVSVANKNKTSSSSSSSSSPTNSDPNDPSQFTKNDALKQSLYGIAYTPEGSQLPDCGNSLEDVITDIQLMSQLTTRIRLYGADCNQSALVLEAIKQTKVNMTVWLGNYPSATDSTAYTRQRDLITAAIQTYGTDHIGGITVGNEFILDYLGANGGGSDPNSDIGNQGAEILLANIQDTISTIGNLSLDVTIPIGNADAGSYFNDKVLAAVDYGMANVHPWFANVSVEESAGWTWEFFQENDVELAQSLGNSPQMYIAETGWPTNSSDAGNESNGPSTATVDNLQIFLDNFVCQANANGTGYFFFEYFDETWKDAEFGGVEGWWGLFTSNRTLKDGLTIPDCSS